MGNIVGPGDPSWTSALVALVLSWPFDAGIPPGKSVGPFDGTVTAGRPGDSSSSRVGVCRLRRWRCVLQPTPASPCCRLLRRVFAEFGVRLAGRHEPGDQYHSERFEWLHRYRSDHAQRASLRGDFESRKPIRSGGRSDRPNPDRRGSQCSDGNFTVSAQGTGGGLSHGTNLALTIQSAAGSTLSRTAYARTDSTSAADDPFGEPHHRHMAYDAVNKHLFVANRAMNRVEIFSTFDQSRVAQISIAGASSADLSPDGATVWIGTSLQEIVAIDAGTCISRRATCSPDLARCPESVSIAPWKCFLFRMARP